jgi:hypothetical protein
MVKGLCYQPSGALANLSGSFDGTNSGFPSTFANIFRSAQGVERHQVSGSFTDSLGCMACAFAYIATTAADIPSRATRLGRRRRS